MYSTLIKKVNEPKCEHLKKISTNLFTNFIGIGGIDGFVKVVNFDSTTKKQSTEDSGKVHLRYGQTLMCHKEEITVLTWNDSFNKLTTCDKSGDIVVWEFTQEGNWKEEMKNNRNESFVTDLRWSKQGNNLCFVYGDGHTIVGTVEGVRSWGIDLKKNTYLIEWSPDGSNILIAAKNYNVIILASSGQQIGELEIEPSMKKIPLASITWWTNLYSQNRSITNEKHLLLAFENGVACLYDDEKDLDPMIIKTNLTNIIKAEWNVFGDVFIASGALKGRDSSTAISFYSSNGEHIRILKAPDPIICFCWDSAGTRIALETNEAVYFALVKPNYKWCYFSETLVFSFLNAQEHHTLVYWEVKNKAFNTKYVKNMMDITSSKDFCLVTAKISDTDYLLILSNCIGSAIDNKIVNFEPVFIALNNTHAVISNKHYIYIWQFRALETKPTDNQGFAYHGVDIGVTILKKSKMRETVFFVEETPKTKDLYNDKFSPIKRTNDCITSIYLSDEFLFVACNSGRVMKYRLMDLSSFAKYNVDLRLNKIGSSPNSQYLWGINDSNHLRIWDTTKVLKKNKIENLDFDKKEVWSALWSDRESLDLTYLEKNQLNIIRELQVEETLTCNGYLAEYSKMFITIVKLEDLMSKIWEKLLEDPMYKKWENAFVVEEIILKIETKVLKTLKDHLSDSKANKDDLINFVKENDNPQLWEELQKDSLNNLDFQTAEKAMVQTNDLMGLNFINKVKTIENENIQKAEVAQYYQNYDQAEEIFKEQNRQDLAMGMHMKLGNWEKVINIMEDTGIAGKDDENLKVSYTNSANKFLEERNFEKAEEMYLKGDSTEGLINLYFLTEQFDKAAAYTEKIPEKNEFLNFMGNKFENYGLCQEAVNCYLRYGDAKKAIDTCVRMNKWNLAVELAEKNNFFQIDSLVSKFGNILSEKNKKIDLVDLYRKAHRHIDAAKVLEKIGEDFKGLRASPLILKKIYVMSALEMEALKSRSFEAQMNNVARSQNVKNNISMSRLIPSELNNLSEKTLSNPWKGAEAYHFYMLCQAQLYKKKTKQALKTALRLVLYEKELDTKEVYRLIALCSFMNKSYHECSQAISKLEDHQLSSQAERESYRALSIAIFNSNPPKNANVKMQKCPTKDCGEVSELEINCRKCGTHFSGCVSSGQSILNKDYFKCKRCKHKFIKGEVLKNGVRNCPLCHVALEVNKK